MLPLFLDGFALCVGGKSLCRVERAMQLCVISVQIWIQKKKKKSFHIFIIKHNMYTLLSIVGLFTDSEIPLDKTPLKGVTEAKFLGPFLPAHYLPKDTFST